MKLTFQQFSGIAPRIAPRLLPATLAQEALDVKLWSGELRPHYADTLIKYIPSNTQSIYRYKWKNKKYNWLGWPQVIQRLIAMGLMCLPCQQKHTWIKVLRMQNLL